MKIKYKQRLCHSWLFRQQATNSASACRSCLVCMACRVHSLRSPNAVEMHCLDLNVIRLGKRHVAATRGLSGFNSAMLRTLDPAQHRKTYMSRSLLWVHASHLQLLCITDACYDVVMICISGKISHAIGWTDQVRGWSIPIIARRLYHAIRV